MSKTLFCESNFCTRTKTELTDSQKTPAGRINKIRLNSSEHPIRPHPLVHNFAVTSDQFSSFWSVKPSIWDQWHILEDLGDGNLSSLLCFPLSIIQFSPLYKKLGHKSYSDVSLNYFKINCFNVSTKFLNFCTFFFFFFNFEIPNNFNSF